MIVGVPKEIKVREYRVGMVPGSVQALVDAGHTVYVETGAGDGSNLPDAQYEAAGATILPTADEVWKRSQMICKVKEPIQEEYARIQEGQLIYTFLHLAGVDPELTQVLIDRKATAVAYETIQPDDGSLPLLRPMSEVAGKMSIQVAARCLERAQGGRGILMGGVPGVRRARVVVIGGGVVGSSAAKVAVGMGAEVTVIDTNLKTLAYLDDVFMGRATMLYSDPMTIAGRVREADAVIGAVLIPGGKAPKLVTEQLVSEMRKGAVLVDVAVDQGGCIETCKPTTHDNPTYEVHGVVHYCVANMPGAVPQTSTFALSNATHKYGKLLADIGVEEAVRRDRALARGVNTYNGHVTYEAVARDLGHAYLPLEEALRTR